MQHADSAHAAVREPLRTFSQPRTAPSFAFVLGASGLAIALGLAATINPTVAIALALTGALALALGMRPARLLSLLVAAVFVEVVSLGGVGVVALITPVAVIVLLAAATRSEMQIRTAPPLAWAIAYALWALASGLWTVSVGGTTFLLASLAIALVYMFAFAALLDSELELERVLYAFALAALGIGLFAIGAFFLGHSGDLVEGRSAGGTGDPNFFAAYQIVALPLMLALLSRASRPWQRALVYAAILVIIGSVLTSVSRGGLLTLIAVTLIICTLPARSLFNFRRQKAAFVTMVAVGAAISLAAAANEILPRVESVFRPSSSANAETEGSGRLVFWSAAWMSVKERPVLGLGFGSFPRVSNELIVRTPGVNFQHFELRPKGSQVHNAYLGTLAELGVVGLALFLGLLISTALALRRTARRARRAGAYFVMRVANALLLSLVGWSIASIFLSSETSRPLWIVIGLSLALPKLIPDETAPNGSAA
jgi:putative inorganic carbon (hco3(-)) transporter